MYNGRTLNGAVNGGEQRGRRPCFDDGQGVALQLAPDTEHSVVQSGMNITEKYFAAQCAATLPNLNPDRIGFFGTCDTAADKNEETTRMNGAAAQQCDRRSLDHDITRQDAGGNALKFQ